MFEFLNTPKPALLHSIFIIKSAGQPVQPLDSIRAIENEGLQGDRYQTKQGYWDPVEGCQVTIITLHEINHAQKKAPVPLDLGQHRRNLVLTNIHPKKLVNRAIRIGEAVFEFEKPRPPCGYLDQLLKKGTAKALGNKSGFCFKVKQGGRLSVGDEVILLPLD
jgi:MOSC domain-containing protein YiiM